MMVLVPSPYRVACWKFFMLEVYTEICFLAAHKVKFRSMLVYAYTRAHARARVHTHTHAHIHTHARTHTRTHACTHVRPHTDTQFNCWWTRFGTVGSAGKALLCVITDRSLLFHRHSSVCLFVYFRSVNPHKTTKKQTRKPEIKTSSLSLSSSIA